MRVTLGSLWHGLGIILEPFRLHVWVISAPFWGHFGIILGSFGHDSKVTSALFWCHFGIIPGLFRYHSGVISAPFWSHFGIIPSSFGHDSKFISALFWGHFGIIPGSRRIWDHFGNIILELFWDHSSIIPALAEAVKGLDSTKPYGEGILKYNLLRGFSGFCSPRHGPGLGGTRLAKTILTNQARVRLTESGYHPLPKLGHARFGLRLCNKRVVAAQGAVCLAP